MRKYVVGIFVTIFASNLAVAEVFDQKNIVNEISAADSKIVEKYQQDLTQALDYLNSASTMTANFVQTSPMGDVSNGKFFLKRPGKLRWEYEPPMPRVVVVNGKNITYYDIDLEQISYASTDNSLADFLARKNISFSGDVEIVDVKKDKDLVIKITQKKRADEGSLVLVFNNSPFYLKGLKVVDSANQSTDINFNAVRVNVPLDNNVFIVRKKESLYR